MTGKRKRVVITIEQKIEAVKQVENGRLLRNVAADYGVGVSTVSDWVKAKPKFEEHLSKIPKRKTMKKAEYEKLNKVLFLWFTQQRTKGMPLSGPILQEKAKMLAEMLGEDGKGFNASSGWLDRFKNRYGIRQLNLSGEKLSADQDAVNVFKTEFEDFIEGLTKDQIFNADETGLNFKMLPKKSLASMQENTAPGHKMNKERITVLACANASGTLKLPLMCIGKSRNPRALKNVKPNALPVYYRAQKSAWMSSDLFEEWFKKQFVPIVEKFLVSKGLPRKAILLIDNAPTHPHQLRSGDIVVRFLPPNVTSLIQPMDQGVLESFKRHYRGFLLRCILEESESSNNSLTDSLKTVNMKHVVYWCAQSWDKITSVTIAKSWNKLYNGIISPEDEEDCENLQELVQRIPGCEDITQCEVNVWLLSDDPELQMSDCDIVNAVLRPGDDADDTEVDTSEPEIDRVTADEGFKAFEVREFSEFFFAILLKSCDGRT